LFVKKEGAKRPHKAIDLEYVKCQWVIDGDTNGILFIKNMEHFAIFTKKQNVYQEWKEELRSLCLISDFHDEYKVCKLVGNGSFAKVYKAKRVQSAQNYAVKAFKITDLLKENRGVKGLFMEIQVMKAIKNCRHLLKFYEIH